MPEHAAVPYVAERLAEHREEWVWEEIGINDFYVHNPGGHWTEAHLGVIADQAIGLARGGAPTAFCRGWGYPPRRGYSYNLYTVEGANILAREFCRRGQYFYNIFFAADDQDWELSAEDRRGYVESREFLENVLSLDMGHPAFDAALEIRTFFPDG